MLGFAVHVPEEHIHSLGSNVVQTLAPLRCDRCSLSPQDRADAAEAHAVRLAHAQAEAAAAAAAEADKHREQQQVQA